MMRRLPLVLLLAALLVFGGCGADADGGGEGPTVVATTSILGALASDLTGDRARVVTLIPDGTDPHEFSPSARDVEALTGADLVLENGLGLEAGLESALGEARREDVPVVAASDFVEPRGDDPHIWMDPIAMRAVVTGVAPRLEELGIDLGARPARLAGELTRTSADIEGRLAAIPAERRTLVTGHDSMGYFAARYDLEVVGAIIPSLSTQAEVSAGQLAALRDQIAAAGVPAVFTEEGTPANVAEAVGREAGVEVVEIPTVRLPEDGSYVTFIRRAGDAVARGLAP